MNDMIETYVRRNQAQWLDLLKTIIPSRLRRPGTGERQVDLAVSPQPGSDGAYRDGGGNILYPCRLKKGQKAALYTAHMDTSSRICHRFPFTNRKTPCQLPHAAITAPALPACCSLSR